MLTGLVMFACRPDARSGGDGDRTSGHAASGRWTQGQEWRLVEEFRIGSADGGDAYMFTIISGLALDDLGRVWVADAQLLNLRVYDSKGVHLRTVGKKGGGPGEFRWISGMDRRPDGELLVLDSGNSRFAVFDTTGKAVATQPRSTNVSTTPWPGRIDSRGRLYDVAMIRRGSSAGTDALVRFDTAFQPVDTFPLPEFEEQYFEISRRQGNNRDVSRVNVPFAPSQVWSVDPQGYVWIAVTDRYRLERRSFDGRVDRVIEREHTPVPVTDADRRCALGFYGDFIKKGGKIDESRIPDTMPALASFFFDDMGRLWVMPRANAGDNPVLDVFEPTGEYLGRVHATERLIVGPGPAVRGDRMAAVTIDDDGVQSVVVFRIEKPAA
jgi:hypothetical protein